MNGESFLEPKTKEELEVEKYLDGIDLDRLEWQRLQDDLYPGVKPERDED
jgi:hypothetical protein